MTPTLRRYLPFFPLLFLLLAIVHPALASSSDLNMMQVTVLDGDSGEPLIGVNIYTDDHKFTAFTDIDGKATLGNLLHRQIVNFSYLGYSTVKMPFYEIRNNNGLVRMYTATVLDSIVVVGRRDDPVEEIPYVVNRISSLDIASTNSQTSADALRDHGNVFVQKSQMGGGSPVIRGFEANRVLLVVDGVRMNNAIYRNGHLQNAITIDNAMLEQIEVIYGPGSLMYGSDALGGVVHFRSREPKMLFGDSNKGYLISTGAYTRFSSANNEKSFHLDVDYGTRHWGSLTSLTYSDFGDLRAGANRPANYPRMGLRDYFVLIDNGIEQIASGDPNVQAGTGYSQIDFMQKIRYQPSEQLYFTLNFQYSTSSNVPRYDVLTDTLSSARELKWGEWYYGPQKRLMASLKTRVLKKGFLSDKATIIASFQRVDEDRLKRKFLKKFKTYNLEDVNVYSFTTDLDKQLDQDGRNLLSYGVDVNHNTVASTAGNLNRRTNTVKFDVPTRYPSGGSDFTNMGAYINYRWKSQDSTLAFHAGLRYSLVSAFMKFDSTDVVEWPEEFYTDGIRSENAAPTWGLGLTLNTPDQWQVRLLAATAFRAPNIDDMGKLRAKSGFVTAPNVTLGPEKSLTSEITLGKTFGRLARGGKGTTFQLSGTGFYTWLEDVIVRELGALPNGDTILSIDGDPHRVQQNANAGGGYVYGFSGNLLLNINSKWRLSSGINYTLGRVEFKNAVVDTLVPLSHIPPLYGQTSLEYQGEKFRFETVVRYNGRKPLEDFSVTTINFDPETGELVPDHDGTADNIETSGTCVAHTIDNRREIRCEGALGWATLNFYTSLKLSQKISIDLALENALDVHYRPFSSGISAPGRNIIFTLRGNF